MRQFGLVSFLILLVSKGQTLVHTHSGIDSFKCATILSSILRFIHQVQCFQGYCLCLHCVLLATKKYRAACGTRKTINALLAALDHNTYLVRLTKHANTAGETIEICEFAFYVCRNDALLFFLYGLLA